MSGDKAKHLLDHHESVLRSNTRRTAANSAAYLLPHFKPDMHSLDIGCGPGTITIDLARLLPQGRAVGIEPFPETYEHARSFAAKAGVSNVDFIIGNAHDLDFPYASFDVAHSHQVLRHMKGVEKK